MTYRQLLAAIEQAQEWEEALSEIKYLDTNHTTAETRDNHQAQINIIEKALNQEINE